MSNHREKNKECREFLDENIGEIIDALGGISNMSGDERMAYDGLVAMKTAYKIRRDHEEELREREEQQAQREQEKQQEPESKGFMSRLGLVNDEDA